MEPWYKEGLQFECVRCGNCCSGRPGHVWVTDEEIAAIAAYLGLPEGEFRRQYIICVGQGAMSLAERFNHDCIFFNRVHGCVIYEVRPRQCRTWPFWKAVLLAPEVWDEMARSCPGMGRGRTYRLDEIEALVENF